MNESVISEDDEDPFNFTTTSSGAAHIAHIFDDQNIQIAFYLVYSLVFALCVFGNLCVLIVVAVHWRMRNVPKFCMGNLAFANLCVGLFCIYQNLSTFLSDDWIFGRFLCKMYYFTNSLSHTASILILIVICVERYLVILQPFRARRIITTQRLRLTLALVWIVSALLCSPRLYYITTFETPLPNGKYEVICAPKRTLYNSRAADLVSFILLFLIPLLVMTVLYARIGGVIWKKSSAEFQASITCRPPDYADEDDGEGDSTSPDLQVPQNSEATEVYSTSSSSGPQTSRSGSTRSSGPNLMNNCVANSKLAVQVSCNLKKKKKKDTKKKVRISRVQSSSVSQDPSLPTVCVRKCNWRKKAGKAGKSVREVSIQVRDEREGRLLRSRRSIIRMLIAIVVTFALCNFPYHLRKMCQYYSSSYNYGSYYNQLLTPLSFLLMYSNCAINPILYAFMSKSFRMSLRDLIKLHLRRPNPAFVPRDHV